MFKNKIIYTLTQVLLLSAGCGKKEPPCQCSIPVMRDEETGRSADRTSEDWSVSIQPKIKAEIRQNVEAELSGGVKYRNIYEQVNETYWKVRNENPEVNDAYTLYRAIACAYYEIICQDNTISGAERRAEQNKIVKGFESNLKQAISAGPTVPTKTRRQEGGSTGAEIKDRVGSISESTMPDNENIPLFNKNLRTDVAILITGDDPGKNTGFVISRAFQKNNLSTSGAFFNPVFRNRYAGKIQNGDFSFFSEYDVKAQVKCICIVKPDIHIGNASYEGEAYLKADGAYQIDIVNTHTLQTTAFSIQANGVGLSKASALGNLDEKFITKFMENFKSYASCKL